MADVKIPQLLPCPFCGKTDIRIDLEDEHNHWRIMCEHCMAKISGYSKSRTITKWNTRTQQEAELNEPLTLDELRKLNGEPVWLVDGDGNELWGLVDATNDPPEVFDSQYGLWLGEFYNMTGDEKMGLHSEGWVAYRHKPKEGQ